MQAFIPYLIQSGIGLAIFYLIYWIFLRKETFFSVNRAYLLTTGLFTLVLPLIRIPVPDFENGTLSTFWLNVVEISSGEAKDMAHGPAFYLSPFLYFYLTGVAFFLIRFFYGLARLSAFLLNEKKNIIKTDGLKIIFSKAEIVPASFLNFIILPENLSRTDLQKIVAHEKVHLQQFHSIDLLLAELITIFQWFNPFSWLFRKALKNQHEFLADRGVLNKGINKKEYLNVLIAQTFGMPFSSLANNFSQSQIKKRFTMISKKQSNRNKLLKTIIALPAAVLLIYLFSFYFNEEATAGSAQNTPGPEFTNTIPQGQDDVVYTVVEQMPEYPGGEEARIKFMSENMSYPAEARKNGIQGKVFVTFIVEKNGEVSHVKTLRGIGGGCDEEAVRVISMMPDWKPGKQGGKPVRVQFNLPVQFKLDDKKKDHKSGTVPPPPPVPKDPDKK